MSIKYFAKIDEDGTVLGFYPSDIWPVPPAGAIEIRADQWQLFLSGQEIGQKYKFIGGQLVADGTPPTPGS